MIQQQGSNRVYTRETDETGKTIIRVVGTNREGHLFICRVISRSWVFLFRKCYG